jgi:hypothetical protein
MASKTKLTAQEFSLNKKQTTEDQELTKTV